MNRRHFFRGFVGVIAAPAIVKASSLMQIFPVPIRPFMAGSVVTWARYSGYEALHVQPEDIYGVGRAMAQDIFGAGGTTPSQFIGLWPD